MRIEGSSGLTPQVGLADFPKPQTIPVEKPKQESFADLIGQMVNDVSELQQQADATEQQFLKGEISDVHQVMIATEEASVAFQLLMEVRNRLIDAYREIMRMQT